MDEGASEPVGYVCGVCVCVHVLSGEPRRHDVTRSTVQYFDTRIAGVPQRSRAAVRSRASSRGVRGATRVLDRKRERERDKTR